MIKDIFGLLLFPSKIPNFHINLDDFKIEKILEESIKCFNLENLIKCYKFCSKKKKDDVDKAYCCEGLKEAVYQFELGIIIK
jgi:hypothetical protein